MDDDHTMTPLNVRVSRELRKEINAVWRERRFPNRSEFVRSVLRDAILADSDLSREALHGTSPDVVTDEDETVTLEDMRKRVLGPDEGESAGVVSDVAHPADSKPDAIVESTLGYQEAVEDVDIQIIGCGGGGVRVVNRIHELGGTNAQTVTIDTDEEDLYNGRADTRALIGKATFRGDGANGDVESASAAVERAEPAIDEIIRSSELVFVLTGLGGATGTALAPRVAEIASASGAVVVGVATLPFTLERAQRNRARDGLHELSEPSNTVAVLDGNQLTRPDVGLSFGRALQQMNEDVAIVVSRLSSSIGRFRVSQSGESLLTMLEDGGYSLLLKADVGVDDGRTSLPERLLRYSTVDATDERIARAILLITAGRDVETATIDSVVGDLGRHASELAWNLRRVEHTSRRVHVSGILTGVDVGVDDLVPMESQRISGVDSGRDADLEYEDDVEILADPMGSSGRDRNLRHDSTGSPTPVPAD